MCAACAMAAMAGATGARSWLQARHETWLTPRRMKVATGSIFAAAIIGSTVGLKGSTPPTDDPAAPATQAQQQSAAAVDGLDRR
jgi:hypothetical protein